MTSVIDSFPRVSYWGTSQLNSPWSTSGRFFVDSKGQLVRHKGFSSFKLLHRFEHGEKLSPLLDPYRKGNVARIFLYTDPKDWGSDAWEFPSESAAIEFLRVMKDQGFMVHITLCTDTASSEHRRQMTSLVEAFKRENPSNLLLEAVNEPYVEYNGELYGKTDPNEFKSLLEGSGFLYSSGVYANNHKHYGNFWLRHSDRNVSSWFGKGGHELMEAYDGGGPNDKSEPALKQPGVQDEPIRPDQCNYDLLGIYGYAASCGLMGAGATVHTQAGKLSKIPEGKEREWVDMFFSGLDMFPLNAANGAYRRITEAGQSEFARTYVVGNYSVRIKQNGMEHPEGGWTPMDAYGVCWSWG